MPEFFYIRIPAFLMALNGFLGRIQKVYFMKRMVQYNDFGKIAK